MSNPFNTGNFNCCNCPQLPEDEEPAKKYIHRCGCPTAEVVCESVARTATLCGFSEFTGGPNGIVASVPPKKYLDQKRSYLEWSSEEYLCCEDFFCGVSPTSVLIATANLKDGGILHRKYDPEVSCEDLSLEKNILPTLTSTFYVRPEPYDCSNVCDRSESFSGEQVISHVTFNEDNTTSTTRRYFERFITTPYHSSENCSGTASSLTRKAELILSEEDTEEDALARATETEGTSCSSIYQLRTTSFSFTLREVTYTIRTNTVIPGVTYTGCLRIRRREAYSGTPPESANTEWEEIEPQTLNSFTRNPDEDGWTEIETGELPNEQGWEYQIIGAQIWPTRANCDCPTEYEE